VIYANGALRQPLAEWPLGPVSEIVLDHLRACSSPYGVACIFFFHAHPTWRHSPLLAACFASSSSWSFSAKVTPFDPRQRFSTSPLRPSCFPSLIEATAYGVQLYGAGSPNPSAVMAEWATAYKYHRDDVTYVSPFF